MIKAAIRLRNNETLELTPGDYVELTPRNYHATNRLDKQGAVWRIADIRPEVKCKTGEGPFLLLERNCGLPTSKVLGELHDEGGLWLRWVAVNNDENFKVFKA